MRRKVKFIFAVLCISMVGSYSTVFADVNKEPTYDLYAANYLSASASISVSNGTATCAGKIKGIIGTTTKTSVYLYLQKYTNGTWVNVADWASSGNTVNRTLSQTKSVSKGYKYRSKAVCYAYAGTKSEKVIKYSNTVSY